MELRRQLGLLTATLVIVADMIGTGIFMTTGNVLGMTGDAGLVLILWAVAGLTALAGSLCYAELAVRWPENGGEYAYLKNAFGMLPAFLTGWVSLLVGFSAPAALGALTIMQYFDRFWQGLCSGGAWAGLFSGYWTQKGAAVVLVLLLAGMHIRGVRFGSRIQNAVTLLKLLLLGGLIVGGLALVDWGAGNRLTATLPGSSAPPLPLVGLAMLLVSFAFSGWNGATYIGGEIRDPARNLPRILFRGTLLVTVIYLLLNVVYLMAAPGEALAGKDEVAAIAIAALFGTGASGSLLGPFFLLLVVVVVLSSVSAQIMVGPRVSWSMARDGLLFRGLAAVHPRFGTPAVAIAVQAGLAAFYIITNSAMTLMIYMGFALNIFPVLAVIGLIRMRRRNPGETRRYSVPFYPLLPLFYIVATVTMMIAALANWTGTSLFALGIVAIGIPVFHIWRRLARNRAGNP